jgi:hypothetical protein
MREKVGELGIILLAISFMLSSIEAVVRFYNLSKTLGLVKTFLFSFLPFYAFPTYSVFPPLDFLVKVFLVLTPPFVVFRNPLFSPWTLGDWGPMLFCILGALLLGLSYKKFLLGEA